MGKEEKIIASSANRLTTIYWKMMVDFVLEIDRLEKKEEIQSRASLCVFLSVILVETFMNSFFRILVERWPDQEIKEKTLTEINVGDLEFKIKTWPGRFFGKSINLGCGIGQKFQNLKKLRNDLVHYKPTYKTLKHDNIEIRGLTDTSVYDELSKEQAFESLKIAEKFIEEILVLTGASADGLKHALHYWLGKVPEIELGGN